MTQEEKELLRRDFCARLPYGVKIATRQYKYCDILTPKGIVGDRCYFNDNPRYDGDCPIDEFKPYLRPLSSMTEEERDEYFDFRNQELQRVAFAEVGRESAIVEISDWLNKKMFDCRGLIEKGLALEAPEGMYKID